ncbi:MAG: hypothetical protein CGU28_03100 [Candidatus Dactylopiibacterium carminicum]|nr:MAG: hypothetical protein CGU28_03100 [Candidatus Dactylopiibacterium carminicum]
MFDALQRARFGGKPVRFFLFIRQSLTWRYCTADRDITLGEHTWLSAQISRSDIKQTPEPAKDKITIKLAYLLDPAAESYPATQALGDNWQPWVPGDDVRVICAEGHYGATDLPVAQWTGVVTGVKFGDVEMELTCEPAPNTSKAINQGAKWQISCWKTVYSTGLRGCNLIPGPIAVVGTLTAVAGNNITAAEFVAQARTFVGGTAAWLADMPVARSAVVTAVAGSTATLDDVTDIEVGTELTWLDGVTPRVATVSAIAGSVLTLSDVTGLTVDATVGWEDVEEQAFSANITAHAGTTLTLDDVTGLAVASVVTAYTIPLWVDAVLTAVDGLTLTAAEFAGALFTLAGGYLTYTATNGLLIRRGIASHVLGSDTLTLTAGGPNPGIDTAVRALPTCPRTWAACAARGNTLNYGGAIYKPVKAPEGSSMSWG